MRSYDPPTEAHLTAVPYVKKISDMRFHVNHLNNADNKSFRSNRDQNIKIYALMEHKSYKKDLPLETLHAHPIHTFIYSTICNQPTTPSISTFLS